MNPLFIRLLAIGLLGVILYLFWQGMTYLPIFQAAIIALVVLAIFAKSLMRMKIPKIKISPQRRKSFGIFSLVIIGIFVLNYFGYIAYCTRKSLIIISVLILLVYLAFFEPRPQKA